MSNKYLNEFYKLRCHKDILNVISPVLSLEKEITEGYSILKIIRKIITNNPAQKFQIVDLCAGNAIGSILSLFIYQPIEFVYAIDKIERIRKWNLIKNFSYIFLDIYSDKIYDYIKDNTILISIHPCRELARRIIQIYKESKSSNLILIPCCDSKINIENNNPLKFLKSTLSTYEFWCYILAAEINGKMKKDKHILSPKNIIIWGSKN
jgi:hypothetical protein